MALVSPTTENQTPQISLSDVKAEFGASNPVMLSSFYRGGTLVKRTRAVAATDHPGITVTGGAGWGRRSGNAGQIATVVTIPANTTFDISMPFTITGSQQISSWHRDDDNNWYAGAVINSSHLYVGGISLGGASGHGTPNSFSIGWDQSAGSLASGAGFASSGLHYSAVPLDSTGNLYGAGHNRYLDNLPWRTMEIEGTLTAGDTTAYPFKPLNGHITIRGTAGSAGVSYRFAILARGNDFGFYGAAPSSATGWTVTTSRPITTTTSINVDVPASGEFRFSDLYGAEKH